MTVIQIAEPYAGGITEVVKDFKHMFPILTKLGENSLHIGKSWKFLISWPKWRTVWRGPMEIIESVIERGSLSLRPISWKLVWPGIPTLLVAMFKLLVHMRWKVNGDLRKLAASASRTALAQNHLLVATLLIVFVNFQMPSIPIDGSKKTIARRRIKYVVQNV